MNALSYLFTNTRLHGDDNNAIYNLCSGIEALAFSGYVALLGDPIQILFFRKYVPDIEIPLTSASPLSQLNSNTRDSILSTHMGPYRLKSRSGVRRSYILTVIREDFGPKTNWITLKQKTTKKKINPSDTVQFIPGYPI